MDTGCVSPSPRISSWSRWRDRSMRTTRPLRSNSPTARSPLTCRAKLVDRTRVDTDAAAVLLERGGLYLVEIDQRGATRVVVREGEAEVLTEYDTTLVRAGDEAVIDRDSRDRVALYQAPPLTDVEEWARQLEAEAARAVVEPVEPELRYAAQPLARYGSWVDGGVGRAWRPRVEVGWRPYSRGLLEVLARGPGVVLVRAVGLGSLPLR